MSSRERVLAALQCQPVDRIPFTPLLGGYGIATLSRRYHLMPRWQLCEELGADIFVRNVQGFCRWPPESFIPASTMLPPALLPPILQKPPAARPPGQDIEVRTKRKGHETAMIVETRFGTLRSRWQQTPQSPQLPFPIEPLLKTVEDVKVYQHVLERTVVKPWYEDLVTTQATLGEGGALSAYGHCTPVMDLIHFHMGLEPFVYMLQDHLDEMHALLAMMQQVRKKEYQVLAESPVEIVETAESASTSLTSPAYMARYEFPALAEYSEILHGAGKLHLVHMCGKIARAMELIATAPLDGIMDVAPAPTGDCDFRVARHKLCSAGKCMGGGIDCTAFATLTLDQMEEYVLHRLRECAPGTGYLLGSGDCVPHGTPIENLRAVGRAVREFGTYPVSL